MHAGRGVCALQSSSSQSSSLVGGLTLIRSVLHPHSGLHLGGGEGGPSPPLGTLLPPLELNSNILLYNIALLTAPPKS